VPSGREDESLPPLTRHHTAGTGLSSILQKLEEQREQRWKRYPAAVQLKLRWRAATIQHTFHAVPGETILELGAGSGMLTEQLHRVFRGENHLTSIVFSEALFEQAKGRGLSEVTVLYGDRFHALPSEQFDYVIGSGMLWHPGLVECLRWIRRVLKPGGQMLFFEPNFSFPARLFNEIRTRPKELKSGNIDDPKVLAAFNDAGFAHVQLAPHDIVSCRLGLRAMTQLQAKAVLLEHMPVIRSACASICLVAHNQGASVKISPNLAELPALHGAVSVVVPVHNEAQTIAGLVERLLGFYGAYIHEIIIVNDNSTDETASVIQTLAAADPRIHLLNRSKPNGVGLALRDGYRAATGRYILSMDADFGEILPELRGLFRVVAEGHDGAIGSRFSHESILVNYPFLKLFFNRFCHALIKLFLLSTVRDITNNLKLYRSEILKGLEITSPHFSANLETGLKPLLAGYDIIEVPISWINRTSEMGSSSFYLQKVGWAYAATLLACWREGHRQGRGAVQLAWRRFIKRVGLTLHLS
jgi:dolichol-phosphate mannosyltransferase